MSINKDAARAFVNGLSEDQKHDLQDMMETIAFIAEFYGVGPQHIVSALAEAGVGTKVLPHDVADLDRIIIRAVVPDTADAYTGLLDEVDERVKKAEEMGIGVPSAESFANFPVLLKYLDAAQYTVA